ncbi:MAG: wax ester/triacylglycerol synthase family O-acyltransferase [Thermoleophilaceae bacterium]|nr:wax ester/triacylglycerol synthase family O-acyltransferase [Thermoleophilaceae bacterium]
MERMSPLDASFLHIEDGISHMHIGSVAIFEGPPPAYEDFAAMVARKLPLIPRYRQVVRFTPMGLGRPAWIDDPGFNLGYHVRHTALPDPGGEEELRKVVGRLMSQQLDRSKPLWELWVAEGLDHGRWALISKVHHCMVDGVSGTDLMAVLLDLKREPDPAVIEDRWLPAPRPSRAELVAQAIAERAVNPYEYVRGLRSLTRAPRMVSSQLTDAAKGLVSYGSMIQRGAPETTLNGPIGPHRRWDWARTRLSDVKIVRAAYGGTVNDVVLAVITRGFRDLLRSRGEPVAGRHLTTMVPVSVRSESERGAYNNKVSAMFARLPVGLEDPIDRLNAIRSQMEGLKDSHQAVAGEVLTSLTGFAPPMLLALGARAAGRMSQRNLNTITTNVPGPQFPLYALGRRMLEAIPYVPLASTLRTTVAIFSYDGSLTFGVTGDYDEAADIGVLCDGIEDGMDELVALSGASGIGTEDLSATKPAPRSDPTVAPPAAQQGSPASPESD